MSVIELRPANKKRFRWIQYALKFILIGYTVFSSIKLTAGIKEYYSKPYFGNIAATKEHASWGFFDYRMKDEKFEDGYQSMPADWGINSKRKKGFFELLKKMTME